MTVWLEKSLAFNSGKNNPAQKVQFSNRQKTRAHPENRIQTVGSSAIFFRQASRGSTAERKGRCKELDSDARCYPIICRNISIRLGAQVRQRRQDKNRTRLKKSFQSDSFKKLRKKNQRSSSTSKQCFCQTFRLAATRDGSSGAIFNTGRNPLFHELVSEGEQA